MVRALIVVLGSACGRIGFDGAGVGTDGGGTGGDGSTTGDGGTGTIDGVSMACVNQVPSTTFPGGLPCNNWGGNASFTNAGLSESSGTLSITPNANSAGATGRCQRDNATVTTMGAFAEVSQTLVGASSKTRLEIVWAGETYYVGAANNVMEAGAVNAGLTFTGGAIARWWRIHPMGSFNMQFDTSADGTTWTNFAQMGVNLNGMASIRVSATTVSGEAAPGVARFESVNVCP